MPDEIISVHDLRKSYGKLEAVKGISFYAERSKLLAFLGPNGAGKSTTIDILCTLLKPGAGTVQLDGLTLGKDDARIRERIGFVFQDGVLDPCLTVRENLMTRGAFYGKRGKDLKSAVETAAKSAVVTDFIDRPYGKLSGGQRRRADIARALVNTPKILFLDEPTTGLDPKTKEDVWRTVTALQKENGMTIFLTTHYMEEAQTADYIVIINKGEIAAKGTPYHLKEEFSKERLVIKPRNKDLIFKACKESGFDFTEKSGLIVAYLPESIAAIPFLTACKEAIESFEVLHGSMDEVFLNIIGKEESHV